MRKTVKIRFKKGNRGEVAVIAFLAILASAIVTTSFNKVEAVEAKDNIIHVNDLPISENGVLQELTVEETTEETTTEITTVEETTEATTLGRAEVINVYDITRRSGMNAEQFNEVIEKTLNKVGHYDSALYGHGQALEDVETVYNINGLLLLSIAGEESSWGSYGPAKNRCNFWGVGRMAGYPSSNGRAIFPSTYRGFWETGRLIRENYMNCGLTSLYGIGTKYCPDTAENWADAVSSNFETYRNSVISLYGEGVLE